MSPDVFNCSVWKEDVSSDFRKMIGGRSITGFPVRCSLNLLIDSLLSLLEKLIRLISIGFVRHPGSRSCSNASRRYSAGLTILIGRD